jgi:hypothetical protein
MKIKVLKENMKYFKILGEGKTKSRNHRGRLI